MPHTGCPGMQARQIVPPKTESALSHTPAAVSQLGQWPCQIKLAPVNAPYFNGAKLLIAADCTAYAYANIHEDFMKGKVTLIGCPKLDSVDYSEKIMQIIKNNDIKSVTILRMEVPCCGGLEAAVKKALQESGKFIPWQTITISIDGKILDGAHGGAGEIGHIHVDDEESQACGCGNKGCLEQYTSATGIVTMAKRKLKEERNII